jgi:Zn-dependent protease with chaperone function
MKDAALEARIRALADRAGIEGGRIFEVDKSTDTKTANAYVTGLGSTKRIVLYDTLLKYTERQVLFVVGHEMGHYVLDHVVQGLLFAAVLILAGLWLLHLAVPWLIRRYKGRFGFDELADVASLPLVLMLANILALVGSPIGLAFSRHIEHEADRFGLELTQDNHAAATSFARMEREDLIVPRPGWLYVVWRASHPPVGERIDFANDYRPWEEGKPLKYGHLFKEPKEATEP